MTAPVPELRRQIDRARREGRTYLNGVTRERLDAVLDAADAMADALAYMADPLAFAPLDRWRELTGEAP